MKQILLFGAGKSATCLIDYLVQNAITENWHITIADINIKIIEAKTGSAPCTTAVAINIEDVTARAVLIGAADIVISLMPPALHYLIAQTCVAEGKNLLTASYVDEELKKLQPAIETKGLLFLCEMGLDPGIDHMSAMQLIDSIRKKGSTIRSFKSHCGGLVAPESDNNPWHYKISWNPRNVVLAGKAGGVYRFLNEQKSIPYEEIFKDSNEIEVANVGVLAWYANRDSLGYAALYNLTEAATFIRTTLRHPAFCRAWAILVALQMTDENDTITITNCKTLSDWFYKKLHEKAGNKVDWKAFLDTHVIAKFQEETANMFTWLGFFDNTSLPQPLMSSAAILQWLLEQKLVLNTPDKDMVVMVHEISYTDGENETFVTSTMVVKGEDNLRTAMAKTVGLPLGIAAKLILNGTINVTGLHIPILKEIYDPVLRELEENGIAFEELSTDL